MQSPRRRYEHINRAIYNEEQLSVLEGTPSGLSVMPFSIRVGLNTIEAGSGICIIAGRYPLGNSEKDRYSLIIYFPTI